MEQLHHLITRKWPTVLLGFAVLSLVFTAANAYFTSEVNGDKCFEEALGKDINPQHFTSDVQFAALDEVRWRSYVECHRNNPVTRAINAGVFLLDDVWALFFIGLIYLLPNYRDFRLTSFKKILLVVLLLAYGFDFVENAVYLSLARFRWLPAVGSLKLIFYGAALLMAITAGAGKLLWSKRTAEDQ
ncbi:hypothetical protein [Lewinella sp. W8]|uniref:hypothetical protein n=1 Tax=Lewinella sp. W8 TaxID=2528208 RepID=UPI001067315A|nr:hypothetical protein [Lewinella sp. W8]MTB51136.1 hypothetical protein [Lewinella sp. W8]